MGYDFLLIQRQACIHLGVVFIYAAPVVKDRFLLVEVDKAVVSLGILEG
jgi:hypothetical protein